MTVRDDIVANALWGAANEPNVHYSQGSNRMEGIGHPRMLPLHADCSSFATCCYNWAGADDPNGRGYDGIGFTGTLLAHLPEIRIGDAQPGDLIVYGPGTGDHVVIVVEAGSDPMTVSHGQERGPIRVRHSVEARAHRIPTRVLQGVADMPTPAPIPPAPVRRDKVNAVLSDPVSGETSIAELRGDGIVYLRNIKDGSDWYNTGPLPQNAGTAISMDAGHRKDGTLDVSVRTDLGETWVNGIPKGSGPFSGWYVPG